MAKRHYLLFGIIISLTLIVIATTYYPGGSQKDPNSVGYDWKNNYLSNLFAPTAVNGMGNQARYWAAFGVFFLTASFALFFIDFSKKIPAKGASYIIKYCGVGAAISALLAVTPLHDLAVRISSIFIMLSMFYIMVFILKSRLHLFKIFSILNLLIFYVCNFMYFTRSYIEDLPVMQKITLLMNISLVLCLHYFTGTNDFQFASKQKGRDH